MTQNDHVQHGIDDNPNNDPQKGAALGGVGGAAVGAVAGSMAGPVGTIVGAVIGGLAGAAGSGAAVAAVDKVDNDNTVTGIGDGATPDVATGSTSAATTRSWDEVSPHYRQGWEQQYGSSGTNWEEHEPAHRYAWETRNNPQYRDRDWADVETDLERDWATRHPDRPWSSASNSVREGWESTGEVLRHAEQRNSGNDNS